MWESRILVKTHLYPVSLKSVGECRILGEKQIDLSNSNPASWKTRKIFHPRRHG
jgi:hypothetical protein